MAAANELLSAALAQHRAGNLPLAEELYRELLKQAPTEADPWHLLGVLLVQADRLPEGIAAIERAIQLNPANADYFSNLGAAYGKLKDNDAAITNLRHAVRLAPQSASAHYNLGTALQLADRKEEAVQSFRHAVAADPSAAEAHYNLGNTLRDLKRYEESAASFYAAIEARPDYLKALVNLGGVLNELKRRDEAVKVLEKAVQLDPNYARAQLNLGSVQRDAGQFTEAVHHLEIAVQLAPELAEAHNNLGTAYQTLARYDEAMACYEKSLELDPELPDAHFSHATQLLRLGQLNAGFAEYEWRWKCHSFGDRKFSQPRWQGEPLAGKTILLFAEQGLGDTLQFVRYAADVKQRGGKVIVECQPAIEKIVATCPAVDQVVPLGKPLPEFDVYCPLMSLPGVLGLSEGELWQQPYLFPAEERIERWKELLAEFPGFRIGICWQGNREHLFDSQRSLPLDKLARLAEVPSVTCISLQKGFGVDQIAAAPFAVQQLGDSLDADGAFLDTAVVIRQLDLVVTVDTAIAHVAGALGAPVWIPLSAHGDWRWMSGRSDSPWYPSARLFRQQQLGDWQQPITEMACELQKLVATKSTAT